LKRGLFGKIFVAILVIAILRVILEPSEEESREQPGSTVSGYPVDGYKDFKFGMNTDDAKQVIANVCVTLVDWTTLFRSPEDGPVKGESPVYAKECYEMLGQRRDVTLRFHGDKLIQVEIDVGRVNREQWGVLESALRKKYVLYNKTDTSKTMWGNAIAAYARGQIMTSGPTELKRGGTLIYTDKNHAEEILTASGLKKAEPSDISNINHQFNGVRSPS
jgi:hypothetical protein